MKLTILICSLYERHKAFNALIRKFQEQTNQAYQYDLTESKKSQIHRWTFETFEIIAMADAGLIRVGHKRNMLKSWANGDYLCYFDDDDEPSKNYIPAILKAIETGVDVITFKAIHYENERKIFNVDFGDHGHDRDDDKTHTAFRLPNHLCVWKRSLANRTQFPNISFGEDGQWARKMNRWIRSTHKIDEVLYHYWFSHSGTRTQQHRFKK